MVAFTETLSLLALSASPPSLLASLGYDDLDGCIKITSCLNYFYNQQCPPFFFVDGASGCDGMVFLFCNLRAGLFHPLLVIEFCVEEFSFPLSSRNRRCQRFADGWILLFPCMLVYAG